MSNLIPYVFCHYWWFGFWRRCAVGVDGSGPGVVSAGGE